MEPEIKAYKRTNYSSNDTNAYRKNNSLYVGNELNKNGKFYASFALSGSLWARGPILQK